jgi:hypothetical protein
MCVPPTSITSVFIGVVMMSTATRGTSKILGTEAEEKRDQVGSALGRVMRHDEDQWTHVSRCHKEISYRVIGGFPTGSHGDFPPARGDTESSGAAPNWR